MKVLILLATTLMASYAYAWDMPSSAITKFLAFELDGGRLSGDSDKWTEYTTKYIAAPENYDEPGWDVVTVVKSHRVLGVKCSSPASCNATVEFSLFPTANLQGLQVVPHPNGGKQVKIYTIVKQGNSWLIEPVFDSPIISIQTYNRLKAQIGH